MNFGNHRIKLHIYANDHPPPHCHVQVKGKETRVILPSLKILSGPSLSSEVLEFLLDRLDVLCTAYDELNPKQH